MRDVALDSVLMKLAIRIGSVVLVGITSSCSSSADPVPHASGGGGGSQRAEAGTPSVTGTSGSAGVTPKGGAGGSADPRGALCASCLTEADCLDGPCLVNDDTGEHFCGRGCSSAGSCPAGYQCAQVNDSEQRQCVPEDGSCMSSGVSGAGGTGAAPSGGSGGTSVAVGGPISDSCDPDFSGPFCENDTIIGFERGPEVPDPSLEQVREFSVQALNYIRSLTCLPSLKLDSCLSDIGTAALAANDELKIHGYFKANCLNAAHDFGNSCQCDWAQENYGAAGGSRRTWKDGVIVPLCGMMTEPKGVGHRANIESDDWTRVGVGIEYSSTSASWYHEFGR